MQDTTTKYPAFFLTYNNNYVTIYMKGGYTMFRKLVKLNNKMLDLYFGMKETKASQFIMFWAWFALLFKIFIDLTN